MGKKISLFSRGREKWWFGCEVASRRDEGSQLPALSLPWSWVQPLSYPPNMAPPAALPWLAGSNSHV